MIYIHPSIIKKLKRFDKDSHKKTIKTWSRNSIIIPEFMGITFLVHNGRSFIPVVIDDERKIGKKLGEFAPTRKPTQHNKGKK